VYWPEGGLTNGREKQWWRHAQRRREQRIDGPRGREQPQGPAGDLCSHPNFAAATEPCCCEVRTPATPAVELRRRRTRARLARAPSGDTCRACTTMAVNILGIVSQPHKLERTTSTTTILLNRIELGKQLDQQKSILTCAVRISHITIWRHHRASGLGLRILKNLADL